MSSRVRMSLAAVLIGGSITVASSVPAQAAAADTCHPPRYDTVACVCRAAVFVLELVTDKDWQCTS